jgi:hypothetical protein
LRLALAAALLSAVPAFADRITDMPRTERCVYKARLSVAGFYWHQQGRARQDIRIQWHGDETQNEIEFVNRTIDEAYAAAEGLRNGSGTYVSESDFGDRVYTACMTGTNL